MLIENDENIHVNTEEGPDLHKEDPASGIDIDSEGGIRIPGHHKPESTIS